jgi:L-2-hydroxycarboxylate dehydrogenase (NAD+)
VFRGLIEILVAEGVPRAAARATARVLVEGTVRGFLEHGVERIFQILSGFSNGTLVPHDTTRIIRRGPATATIDARHTLGQPVGREAMRLAVSLADHCGVGAVGVRNAGHLGILAYYVEIAGRCGYVGIAASSTAPAAVVPGGSTPVLGTNPIAYAGPTPSGVVVADFSTTATSRGRVLRDRDVGVALPPGMAVDAAARPTTDPQAALEGGLLPLGGGVKGSLVGLLVAMLTGPLVGAAANVDVVGTRTMDRPPNKGDLFLAIDPGRFTDPDEFRECLGRQVTAMAETSPAFHVPGAGVRQRYRAALQEGIPVSRKLAALLTETSKISRWAGAEIP